MQIEMSKVQAEIVRQILQNHIRTVDRQLETVTNLNDAERKVITSGCKIMRELVRQIEKKEKIP